MPRDLESLVRNVNAAREDLAAAERVARRKRSDYHAAIGELSHAGLTVREIGKAVDLSFQRVQQILGALVCSFCEQPASEVQKLIAGGGERRPFICDGCVSHASAALRTKDRVVEDGPVMSFTTATREACDFCGCRIGDRGVGLQKIAAMATFNRTWICRQCVKACADVLQDDWKAAGRL
jgi:hypothetical protein